MLEIDEASDAKKGGKIMDLVFLVHQLIIERRDEIVGRSTLLRSHAIQGIPHEVLEPNAREQAMDAKSASPRGVEILVGIDV